MFKTARREIKDEGAQKGVRLLYLSVSLINDVTLLLELKLQVNASTRILGRRAAAISPFLMPYRVPHGFTPRS